jgi:Na+-translocating ferredoxin:NAD+ oxidoreductase RnfC subunit
MNIVELVKKAGVVGAGGAGFPTHVKLSAKVDTVIANGAECEPLLRIDQQMAAKYCEKLVRGVELAMQATGAGRGIIALKEKYHSACEAVSGSLSKRTNITVEHLGNFYPAGDEHVLVYDVTGRIIPESGIPLAVNCIVDNVVTLINVADAVDGGAPVTHRPVTVCGAVRKPVSLNLPVGTSFEKAIELAGGAAVKDSVILDGGPMMGCIATAQDVVTKKTSGIIVLPWDNECAVNKTMKPGVYARQVKSACEQCKDCTEICPRYLLGHKWRSHEIQRSLNTGLPNESLRDNYNELTQVFLCTECGLCDWVCPVKLLPSKVNGEVKRQLIAKGIKNPNKGIPPHAHPMREYRKVPVERVMARFGLLEYNVPAPLVELDADIREVRIPLQQHTGAPAKPTVKSGDTVKKGDLIAAVEEGKLGANVHASISGRVLNIDTHITINAG